MIKFTELENRVKRIEAIENEAREVLKENGQQIIPLKIMWKHNRF